MEKKITLPEIKATVDKKNKDTQSATTTKGIPAELIILASHSMTISPNTRPRSLRIKEVPEIKNKAPAITLVIKKLPFIIYFRGPPF